MNNHVPSTQLKRFRKTIGLVVVIVLVIHVALCFAMMFFSGSRLTHNVVGKAYSVFALLGPFFDEARIQHAFHFSFRYQVNGEWTNHTDLSDRYFKQYLKQPWNYQNLIVRDYLYWTARKFDEKSKNEEYDHFKNSYAFKQLNKLVRREISASARIDSIQIIHFTKWSKPYSNTVQLDTLFNVKYSPAYVEASN